MNNKQSQQKTPPVFTKEATPIGAAILAVAEAERVLEPDMFISNNLDLGDEKLRAEKGLPKSRIREFFVQGVRGAWVTKWDQDEQKLNWCAAFASFCYRTAHKDTPLPVKLVANVTGFATGFAAKDRLVKGTDLWSGGALNPPGEIARMPGPGDIVLFSNHVALLRGIDTQGNIHTVEGNTYEIRGGRNVWGIYNKMYTPKGNPKRWINLKFGLGASI